MSFDKAALKLNNTNFKNRILAWTSHSMVKHEENITKLKSAIVAVLVGSVVLFFLIGLTFLIIAFIYGVFFTSIAFSELKSVVLQSIWPTILALGFYGYRLPMELQTDKENYQIAFRYTFLINSVYWISFLSLNLFQNDINKVEITIALIGFASGILLWPYTLGAIVMSVTKKMLK